MKKNLILIIILAILGGSYFLLTKSKDIVSIQGDIAPFEFQELNYDSFSYTNEKGEGIKFTKDQDQYYVNTIDSNTKYPTQKDLIETMIKNIKDTKFIKIAANNKTSWGNFELNSSGSKIIIDGKEIIFGKMENYQNSFIAISGNEKVYTINKPISMFLNKGNITMFRDKTIFSNNNISKIKTSSGEEEKVYEHTSSGWTLSGQVTSVNHLLNLSGRDIIKEKTFDQEKDGFIKYYSGSILVKELKIKLDENSGYIEKDGEYFVISNRL